MRQPLAPSFLRMLFIALALAFVGASGSPAFADTRSEARTHYQAGVKFYAGGDYRSAIREFSAAQQLMPADLNNYNLALCYDKLGDAEPAMQYYRAYLDKVPNTDKRAEIDASVARLDAAAKSAAAKKADEARKVAELRKQEDARIAAEEQKRADAARRAEEARLAAEAARRPIEAADPMMPPTPGTGSTGTPSTGVVTPTGDAQLDRVQGIDVNSIRDQRVGGQSSGIPANDPRGPSTGVAVQAPGPAPGPAVAGAPNGPSPNGAPVTGEPPKAQTPIYKKWWFWAVVAVSAYVVYQIATDDASDNSARLLPEVGGAKPTAQPGGLTLMSW
ncbi:MAG: hypothetical protein H0T46_32650 [Deltaproteobacteria bacterium]|nr:hypothetical protein [Deltaproteobacteria bacterium]